MGRGVRLQYLKRIRKPSGRVYTYLAKPGAKMVRLPDLPENHPDFLAAYARAYGSDAPVRKAAAPGSVSALCASFRASHAFRGYTALTRRNKAGIMARLEDRVGHVPVRAIQPRHIAADLERQKPAAANNLLKVWRALMKHAKSMGMIETDPSREVERVKVREQGHHTWTDAEIDRFCARWPSGSMPRLAMALLLYLGQRRSDVVKLGRQHVEDGGINVAQDKTGARLWIPLHPELASEIPSDRMTFLVTSYGRPFASGNSFGNWFKDRAAEAGLPHWSTHGGRKAAARRLAEAGATAHQIMAITGHKTLSEVERYTRAAEQRRMAVQAVEIVNRRKPAGNSRGESQ